MTTIGPNGNEFVQQKKIYEREDIDVHDNDMLSKVLSGLTNDVNSTVKNAEMDSKIVVQEYNSIKNLENFVGKWLNKVGTAKATKKVAKYLDTAFNQLVNLYNKLVYVYIGDKNDISEIRHLLEQDSDSDTSQTSLEPNQTDADAGQRDVAKHNSETTSSSLENAEKAYQNYKNNSCGFDGEVPQNFQAALEIYEKYQQEGQDFDPEEHLGKAKKQREQTNIKRLKAVRAANEAGRAEFHKTATNMYKE